MNGLPNYTSLYQATIAKILVRPSWDVALVLAIFAVLFFYGLAQGKRRLEGLIIYMYVALALLPVLPLSRIAALAPAGQEYLIRPAVFLILSLLLFFLLKSRGRNRLGFGRSFSWAQTFVLSIVLTGFLGHILIGFLPVVEQVKILSPLARSVFAGATYAFWWTVLPLAVVVIARKIDRD